MLICVELCISKKSVTSQYSTLWGLIIHLGMCRYDRSLWHTAPTPVSGPAHTLPAACKKDAEGEARKHAMSRGTLQCLKQRMATVLDVELCNAS